MLSVTASIVLASTCTLISVLAVTWWLAARWTVLPEWVVQSVRRGVFVVARLWGTAGSRRRERKGHLLAVISNTVPLRWRMSVLMAVASAVIVLMVALARVSPSESVIVVLVPLVLLYTFSIATETKRRALLNSQLLDAIFLLSGSQRAGFSLVQSLEFTARECGRPVKDILGAVVRDIKYGLDLEEALRRRSAELRSEEFELLVTALTIQRQTGGNVAEVLERIGDNIRDRRRVEAKLKAVTIQGKLTGAVVVIVPVGLLIILQAIAPEFLEPLWATSNGRALLSLAMGLQLVGALLVKRITAVRF